MGCCGSRNEDARRANIEEEFDDVRDDRGGRRSQSGRSSRGGRGASRSRHGGRDDSSPPGQSNEMDSLGPRRSKKKKRRKSEGGGSGPPSRASATDVDPCGLTNDTIKFLTEEFNFRDKDRSNGIDRYELQECMEGLGIELSDSAVKNLVSENATDEIGAQKQINLQAFIRMMAPYMRVKPSDALDEEQLFVLKQNFSSVDEDGNGTIDSQELKGLLIRSGKDVTDDQVEAILEKYDADGNGVLSFDEFVEMVLVP